MKPDAIDGLTNIKTEKLRLVDYPHTIFSQLLINLLNHKNKGDTKMENSIKELPQNWGMYMQRVDDKPAITRTNLALFDISPVQGYKQRIQFAVYYRTSTESGLPTAEENPKLWEIEDAMTEIMNTLDVIDVGLMKWNNRVNFFMYTENAEGIEEALANILKEKFPDYKYRLWADEDEVWECYFETLYPNKYSRQEIENNKVLQALQNDGDDLSRQRLIEHWAYFNTKESSDKFIEKVKAENFQLFTNEVLKDEKEYPYQVGVSRSDFPDDIHKVTWFLLDMAEESDGYYDGWGCGIEK